MATVRQHLDGGQHVILGGAAGLGKTRLAAELADHLTQQRVTVHRVVASPAAAAATFAARRAGATKESVRLDGWSGHLLARCGGANTPLLSGRSRNGPLSEREREIARLASDGLSNRQIAERLVVSERTVENHLYRIFIKLGISGRDQLASALTPR